VPEPGAIYVMDRGYMDFHRLYALHTAHAIFIMRAKQPLRARRRYSHPVDQAPGMLSDHTIVLTRPQSAARYPAPLRRVRVPREGRPPLRILTNDFALPASTIAALYRDRWRVELFFRWIKQHLHIKRFYGTSPNAVAVQVWTALCTYLLVAIARKRLGLTRDLYTMLQVLSSVRLRKCRWHKHLRSPASRCPIRTPLTSCPSSTSNRTVLRHTVDAGQPSRSRSPSVSGPRAPGHGSRSRLTFFSRHVRQNPQPRPALRAGGQLAVITLLIPPRILKSPTTVIVFGVHAATRSSMMRFTARS
jgi:hypothetical protein